MFLQNFITLCYSVFELRNLKEKKKKLSIIAPYITEESVHTVHTSGRPGDALGR